ncbi:Ig-like domain-containing protein [uncultured Marinobacter sp.]|uniref:Ig-like domain-containing protein n=2 Tax=uncultured Marinobacter sp. TaxID=187379 RepID=UPI0025861DBD|nr:Ig-like domain-containing protein [uncultured Marinobacter sp.]
MNGSRNTLFAIGKLLRQYAEHEPRFSEHQEQRDPGLSAPKSQLEILKQWIAVNTRMLGKAGFSSALLLPVMAKAAADQLQSNKLQAFVSVESLEAEGAALSESAGTITLPDGTVINLDQATLVNIGGEQYVLLDAQSVPEGALTGTTSQGNPSALIRPESLEGVVSAVAEADDAITLIMDDGSSTTILGENVVVAGGNTYLLPEGLDAVGGGALEATATSAATEYPLSTILLGGLGAIGLAVGLSGGGGGGSATPPPEEPDTTAPEAPTVSLASDTGGDDEDSVTNDATLTITAEAGATVEVFNGDTSLGQAEEDGDNPGTFSFVPELTDGEYSLTAVATDAAGNASGAGELTFTLDTVADAGTVSVNAITADDVINAEEAGQTIPVSGTASGGDIAQGDAVAMIINGQDYTTTVGANGAWSVDVAGSDLAADTEFEVVVSSTDDAGNTVDSTAVSSHVVDTVAPDAPTVSLTNDTGADDEDSVSNDATLTMTAEAGSTVEVFNGETSLGPAQEDPDNAGTFTFEPTGLTDGSYTLTAIATDAAGNTSAGSGGIAVTLDTAASPPTLALVNDTGVSGSDGVTSDGALAVSGLEAGATWEYSVDGGENWVEGNGTGFSLDEGDYADGDVQVRQTDAAGNLSTPGSLGAVTVDQTLPEVVIDATALNNLELGQTESVTFSFSEAPYQFTATDITLPESLALSSLSVVAGTNGQTYRADVSVIRNTGITDGVVSVGTGISDLAGNSPLAAFSSQPFSVVQADPLIVGGVDAQFETVEQALAVSAGNETLLLQDSSFNLTTLTNDQEAVFRNLSDVEMNSGSRLTLPADLATATTITAADTASVVITGLDDQDYDFSAITVADGKVATTVNQDVSLNTNTDLGSLLIGVNQGATLTLTAAQADARIISGEGGVQITALEATPDADLSAITATGNVEANFNAGTGTDVTFTGQLGGAEVSVTSGNLSLEAGASTDAAGFAVAEGASLTGSAAQLDGLTITGSGGVSVTDLAENTDLSGFADALDVTASVNQSLDLRSNPDLNAVDAYQVAAGATLNLTAAQANGLTISGDGNLIISNLSETPDADLSGITANTEVQVTSSVEFTGNAGDPASVGFTVEEGRTLALDSGAVDGRTIEGSGTLAVTGTVAADGNGSAALDVSNLTVNGVDLTGATLDPDISDLTLASSSVFTLLPEQAEQLTLTGNEGTNSLTIDVSGLFAGGGTSADLAVNVSTLGGDDTLRFNFGPGEDNRQLNLTGTINLGEGTNVLEVSNGVVSIAGLTEYSGVTIVQINSTLVLSADQFSDQLADLENNPDSALRGAGSIEVTGTLSDGNDPIDLNLLGNFEPGGATPPTVAFPAGFVEGTDFILPTNTESLLTVTVGGVEDDIFNGDYTPVEVTAFTASQLTGALGIGTVETIKLANSITLNQSLDTSASNVTFDFTAGALNLEPGVGLTLSAAQADGARVSGEGSLTISGATGDFSADLSRVSADTVNIVVADNDSLNITGTTNVANASVIVPAGATLVVNASQASGLNLSGDGAVTILLDSLSANLTGVGADTGLDLTTVVDSDTPQGEFTGRFGDSAVEIGVGQTLTTSAVNIDGRAVSGEGNITLVNPGSLSDRQLDLSGVENTGDQILEVTNSVPVLGGDLGTFSVSVSANATFSSTAALLDGVSVTGEGNVRIGGLDAASVGADFGALAVTGDVEIGVAESITRTLPLPDGALVTVPAGATLTLSPDVLADLVIFGNGNLALTVDQDDAAVGLSLVLVEGDTNVSIAEGVTVDLSVATLAEAAIELAAGANATLSAAQLDGRSVTGDGSLEIIGLDEAPDADLSGIADTITRVQDIPSITVNDLTDDNVVNTGEAQAGVEVTGTVTNAEASPLEGLEVTVTLGETEFTATTDAQGQWSVTLPQNRLADQGNGETSLTASVTNASGNSGIVEQTFTIDLAPPPAPTLALAEDTGAENSDGITSNGTVTVGNLQTGASWEYSVDGGENWIIGEGNNFDLEEGSYPQGTVLARQTSDTGNTSVAGNLGAVSVDSTSPAAPTLALAVDSGVDGDGISNDDTLTINAEAGSVVTVVTSTETLGTATEETPGVFTFDPEIADGTYNLTVTTTDAAGNISSAEEIAFQLDTQAPDAPTLELVNDTSVPGDNITSDLTLAISAEAGSTVEVFNGTTSLGFATAEGDGFVFTPDKLPDGDYSLTARATDAAGNTSAASAPLEATLQPDVDTVTNEDLGVSYSSLTEAVAAASEGHTLTLASGTYTENVVIDKALTINGANAGEAPVDAEGNPLPDLTDGVRTNDESWINGKLTIAAANVVIDGVRLHNPDGPLDWDESLLTQGGGGLDGFQLLNSYLTGYTGNGAPRFNGDGDYVGQPVASNWVIENNLIGGMIDGSGGALYLSGLADSSISDNVFWRPAAGHLYVSSLQNTAVEDNQFYHGVHAGGADFDGLADALLEANGFGYGDANTDGPDGYGADGYGGTYFGRNFWIEVKGANSDVSITGNTGQYNSGGIQLYGEGNEAYSFADFTISNNVFEDFINADPAGVLDGTGRSVSGFNGAINVSVLNDSQATNLVVTNNTITAAADQVYSARDFFSLINIQGKVTDLTVTGNATTWGESSQAVIDALDALGLSLADYEGQLQGIALTGGIAGEAVITGNTLETGITATTPDDGFVGIVIRNDVGSVVEGVGFYTALTTVDESNTFQLDNPAGVPLGLIGFTESQLEALFDLGLLNETDIFAPPADAPLEPDFQTVVAEALQLQPDQDFELVDRYAAQELPAGGWLVRADVLETQEFPIGYEHWFLLDEQGGVLADQAFNAGEGVFMRSLGSADSNAVYVQQITVTGDPGADPLNVTQDQPPTIHSVDITNVAVLANLLTNSGGESLTSADNLVESWTISDITDGQLDTLETNQVLIGEGCLPGVEGKNTAVFALEDLAQDQVISSWFVSEDVTTGALINASIDGELTDLLYLAQQDPQGIYALVTPNTPDPSGAARFDIASGNLTEIPDSLFQALSDGAPLEGDNLANFELANGGSDTIEFSATVSDGQGAELLNFSFDELAQGGDIVDLTGLPTDFASGVQIVDAFADDDTLSQDIGLLVFTTQPDEATTLAVEGALQQGQTLFVLADPSNLNDQELADVGVGLFRLEDQGQTSDLIANFSDLSAADLAGISGSNFLDFEEPQQVTG